ncbi:MAG TPA: MBL fold metallo-hydrolase, partial [Candidatus Nanopelagicales bacterium]|nr:MBL fold metallo-hydrolase [Candidatus Nanopelagicales bacterium]
MRLRSVLAGVVALGGATLLVGPPLRRAMLDRGAIPDETRRPLRARPRPGEEPLEIAPDVFLLGPWGRTQTNVYLVRGGSAWVLVDAGWEGDAPRIEAAARTLVGPGTAPAAILLTHDHPDHAGAARALGETWRCPILMHPAETAIANGDFKAMERFAGPLDRWVILPAMRAIGERRRAEVLLRGSLAGLFQELDPGG